MSDLDLDTVITLYESGLSQINICKQLHCGVKRLRAFMKENGITIRKGNVHPEPGIVYMKIGPPPYCLPEMIADSCDEMAEMTGESKTNIKRAIYLYKTGKLKAERYCAVTIDDKD